MAPSMSTSSRREGSVKLYAVKLMLCPRFSRRAAASLLTCRLQMGTGLSQACAHFEERTDDDGRVRNIYGGARQALLRDATMHPLNI